MKKKNFVEVQSSLLPAQLASKKAWRLRGELQRKNKPKERVPFESNYLIATQWTSLGQCINWDNNEGNIRSS